jgi:hypothetical protein
VVVYLPSFLPLTAMMVALVRWIWMMMTMILGSTSTSSTSQTMRVLAGAEQQEQQQATTADNYDQRDHGFYMQQISSPVASRFPNYYREASDLLVDLAKFETIYVQYHSCQ